MPSLRIVKVRKQQDIPYGLPYALGLQIMSLMKQGYKKFELEDLGEVVEIKTWRLKRKMISEVERNAIAVS